MLLQLLRIFSIALLFFLLACEEYSIPKEEPAIGSHLFTILGLVDLTSTGSAKFTHTKITNPEVSTVESNMVIKLENNENPNINVNIIVIIPGDYTGIKPDSYKIDPTYPAGEPSTMIAVSSPELFFSGSEGSVTLTQIGDQLVQGTFEATLFTAINPNDPTFISGQFTAIGKTKTLN